MPEGFSVLVGLLWKCAAGAARVPDTSSSGEIRSDDDKTLRTGLRFRR